MIEVNWDVEVWLLRSVFCCAWPECGQAVSVLAFQSGTVARVMGTGPSESTAGHRRGEVGGS